MATMTQDTEVPELTDTELLDIRARQRTFDGAYNRTALNAISVGILILKIFSPDFFYIGLVFILYGFAFFGISWLRQRHTPTHDNMHGPFRTSGDFVLISATVALLAYIALIALLSLIDI